MHSSRMRTAHSLTASRGGGGHAQGCASGCVSQGGMHGRGDVHGKGAGGTDLQTRVNTLPCRKLRLRPVNIINVYFLL